METEYLALWVHFLWSGGLTMAFCLAAWWKMGILIARSGKRADGVARSFFTFTGASEVTKKRHRLLRIAIMTSFCLLVMMGALLATSSKLDAFNRTADLSLACSKETVYTRNFPAYGFTEGDSKTKVCGNGGVTESPENLPCKDGCFWYPALTEQSLACVPTNGYTRSDGLRADSLEDLTDEDNFDPEFGWPVCDCDCQYYVELERPRCT
jgi:hypothetical protein